MIRSISTVGISKLTNHISKNIQHKLVILSIDNKAHKKPETFFMRMNTSNLSPEMKKIYKQADKYIVKHDIYADRQYNSSKQNEKVTKLRNLFISLISPETKQSIVHDWEELASKEGANIGTGMLEIANKYGITEKMATAIVNSEASIKITRF